MLKTVVPSRDAETPEAKARRELKNRIQQRLIQDIDNKLLANTREMTDAQRNEVMHKIMEALSKEENVPPLERDAIAGDLYAEIIGFGPIQALLDDPEVSEVMVNSKDLVYVEKKGKLVVSDVKFATDQQVLQVIEKIVAPLGRRIDEGSPMVDARLPDGSRVNAIIPPLALKGPSITIRKFSKKPFTIDNLVEWGTLTKGMAMFLEACVKARLNVVVSGGTGSGKTTTLNILSSFIPDDERIVTIEDAAELQLRQEHVVSLETRPANIEGKGEISIRHLVKNSLRMRPDRIVVGECRGGEALDMLQAMNTGHDGSLTTGHANSPRDMLARLETMVMMAGMELPVRAIREQIASAVDLIVQVARLKDGTRRITHITEVQGMEGDVVVLQDIFTFKQSGLSPEGKVLGVQGPTGIRPKFYEKLVEYGCSIPDGIFEGWE
ncbi:MAG TPA: CpaF family protein [Symbiobacteriaceae bacterium]|nr:CpaF family protein [Symbiobacteriaceae bacterium]